MTAIHQVVPTFETRDAVGNEVRALRDGLRTAGYASDVFTVLRRDDDDVSLPLDDLLNGPRPAAVIYHYAVASEATARLASSDLPLVVVHHNITPPGFFWGYDLAHFEGSRLALEEVRSLSGRVRLVVVHSEFTLRGVEKEGLGPVVVVPLALRASARSRHTTDHGRTQHEGTTLLTVGRVAPNKRIEDAIRLLHAFRHGHDSSARLLIAGDQNRLPVYRQALEGLVVDLGEQDAVVWLGKVSDERLESLYLQADVYVSMSAHEGFGGPLVEAMASGLAVLAVDAGAVAETLGGAGMLLRSSRPLVGAEALRRLLDDEGLRRRCVERGLVRAEQLAPHLAIKTFIDHLTRVGVAGT